MLVGFSLGETLRDQKSLRAKSAKMLRFFSVSCMKSISSAWSGTSGAVTGAPLPVHSLGDLTSVLFLTGDSVSLRPTRGAGVSGTLFLAQLVSVWFRCPSTSR